MTQPTCETCRFWFNGQSRRSDEPFIDAAKNGRGTCQVERPSSATNEWPITHKSRGCGQYKPTQKKEADPAL